MKKRLLLSFFLFIFILPTQVIANNNNSSFSTKVENNRGWVLSKGNWYYSLNSSYVTGWLRDKNMWYFLDFNGVMKTGWLYDQNQWYFLDNNGAMKTGWLYDQNQWYFLDSNGAMKTKWIFNRNDWYFLNHNGAMEIGWIMDNNSWYYLSENGSMKIGWIMDSNNWYYLKKNGSMHTGWLKLKHQRYYLHPSGKMATGWYKVDQNWYFSHISGNLAINTLIDGYYVNNDGVRVQPYYVDGVLLVNKNHSLPPTYTPGESSEAREAFESMKEDALKDGLVLQAFSTYRSYSYQSSLYSHYVSRFGQDTADTFSAKPGYSEHQTGLGFDIGGMDKSLWAGDKFVHTAEASWLAENSHYYGFILRYPLGKQHITGYKFEPWHFRYVGPNLAKKIYESGLSLEEYLGES